MKRINIKGYSDFLLEFKENDKNTPTLYKDENMEIKVAKTFDSCKLQNKNTNWCSSSGYGFYSHNKTSNMYRINFKDGYKLRLTWDYIDQKASELGEYSGGTHWGQGGIVNGQGKWYLHIRPVDESEPFLFNYNKDDDRKEMVDRIESIPKEAQEIVHRYQDKHSLEKSEKINNMYKEIEKIKILYIQRVKDGEFDATVSYLGKNYIISFIFDKYDGEFIPKIKKRDENGVSFLRIFKNTMVKVEPDVLIKYLVDKFKGFAKSKSIDISNEEN